MTSKTTPAKYIAECIARVKVLNSDSYAGHINLGHVIDALDTWVKRQGPSGSGIDRGTVLHLDLCTPRKITMAADFHHMDEHGCYDGWTHHNVVVTPGWSAAEVSVTGRDRNDTKDYLGDVFHTWLNSEIDHPGLVENTV